MNYKDLNLGDWIGHISGVIEDESELDGNEMRDLVEFLTTLEQEPKTGHWTEKGHNFEKCWAECSVCGKTARGYSKDTGWGFTYSYTDYCPNCGARMESEDT